MTRDPYGVPPEYRTVRRPTQGSYPPVEPPPTAKQPVRPDAPVSDRPPPPPPAPPPARRPDLDPDRWGYAAYAAPPPPTAVATPPAAARARRGPSGRGWAAMVVAILVVAAAVVVTVVVTSGGNPPTSGSPSATVQTYLRDLAAHDASGALAQGKSPTSRDYLTDDILRRQQAIAPISGVRVGPASIDGDHAHVRAQYRFGSRNADTSYALTRADGRWQLDQTTFRIEVSLLAGIPSATVFDKPIGGVRAIDVFPGPVQWGSGNRYFAVIQKNADRFALSPTDPDASYAQISTTLNSAGVSAIRDASAAFVNACKASKSLRPKKCPQQEYPQGGAVTNSATWTVTTKLNPALRIKPSDDAITTIMVEANLRWTCVYTVTVKGKSRRVTDRSVQGQISGSVDLTAAKPVFVSDS